jgi:hypothetical protein
MPRRSSSSSSYVIAVCSNVAAKESNRAVLSMLTVTSGIWMLDNVDRWRPSLAVDRYPFSVDTHRGGATHEKLAASFGSPVPMYFGS